MHSLIRAASRRALNVLLAGLVGFAVIGSTGVAIAADPTPGDHAPLKHGYKSVKASKRAAAGSNLDVPTVDRDFGCLIPKAPDTGPGVGAARVTVTDRHEPEPPATPAANERADAGTFTYKVTLLKNEGGENYKESKSVPDVKVEAGKASKPVEFKDIPGGTYKVQVQLVKDGKPIDGILTEKSELDRCSEIQGPTTGPVQVFQRCDASKGGLLTIRAFAQTTEKTDYTITVTGEADRTETQLSTDPDEQNYGIPYNEVPFEDGTYTVRVFVKGDSKIDQSQVVTVACKASHQPSNNPTPPAKPVTPVENVADTHALANTGASVLWPTVAGVAVLALGCGLLLFSRRRGAKTSK